MKYHTDRHTHTQHTHTHPWPFSPTHCCCRSSCLAVSSPGLPFLAWPVGRFSTGLRADRRPAHECCWNGGSGLWRMAWPGRRGLGCRIHLWWWSQCCCKWLRLKAWCPSYQPGNWASRLRGTARWRERRDQQDCEANVLGKCRSDVSFERNQIKIFQCVSTNSFPRKYNVYLI